MCTLRWSNADILWIQYRLCRLCFIRMIIWYLSATTGNSSANGHLVRMEMKTNHDACHCDYSDCLNFDDFANAATNFNHLNGSQGSITWYKGCQGSLLGVQWSQGDLREDINRKKTYSFGHCPNPLNPPPPWPQFGQLGPFFSDVKNDVLACITERSKDEHLVLCFGKSVLCSVVFCVLYSIVECRGCFWTCSVVCSACLYAWVLSPLTARQSNAGDASFQLKPKDGQYFPIQIMFSNTCSSLCMV